jgi:peptide/nickel transport system permease protein
MTSYLIRRFFQSIIFILVSALVVYTVLVMFIRVEPTSQSIFEHYQAAVREANANPLSRALIMEQVENYEDAYELDKPWPLSFLAWLFDPADTTKVTKHYNPDIGDFDRVPTGIDIQIGDLRLRGSGFLTGDLSEMERYARGVPVAQLIGERWSYTWPLLASAIIIALLVGIPLGVMGAIHQRSRLDHFITFISFSGLSVPPFVLGLILIIVLAVLPNSLRLLNGWTWLPNLPPGGLGDSDDLVDRIRHMVLPATTLAIPMTAILARYSRFAMLEVLRQDYIRTAWAKGLSSRRVVFKHALRNALIPVITVVALMVPTLITGTVVVESVFSYHGMGHLYYRALGGCLATQSLLAQEPPPCPRIGYYPIETTAALALTVIFIIVIAFANILADILYAVADPRVNLRTDTRT